ncbi:MAG: DegV family protein, partial [Anaerolineae bacterium]|nr:DegV family protein [Anaerolineae bacterium]
MSSKRIRFVTDSTCDIPPEFIKRWQISVIPAFVNYGGKSYADDGIELNREVYYNQIATMASHPTTAAPAPGLAEKIIMQAAEQADHLIMLTAPAALSGIYNAFRLGALNLPPDRVTLIDSGSLSMGLGFQVLVGAQTATETDDIQEIVNTISKVRANERVYAVPESMEFLRRSGRVGWAAASVGSLLQIKPVVEARDGAIVNIARVRTFSKAIDKLIELAEAEAPLERLAILHANNPEDAVIIKERLASIVPAESYILNVTPTIGTHIGPRA